MRMNSPALSVKVHAVPAHLGWRLVALIYDSIIALALLMFSSTLVVLLNAGSPVKPGGISAFLAFVFFWSILGAYAIISWRRGGQTLGMRPWRLKVLQANGTPANWRALGLRYVIASMTLGLSLFWSLFDSNRRALHDIASGTVLVRLQAPKSV